jgi:hypothetical protein
MPLSGERTGLRSWRSDVAQSHVVSTVLKFREQLEIPRLVVGPVMVVMVNVVPCGDGIDPVISLPNDDMKTHTIALKILSAKVVANTLKLLNGVRNNSYFQRDTWLHCDTPL